VADVTFPSPTDVTEARCPSCSSGGLTEFYEAAGVPAHSCVLLPTREEALSYPTGDVRLAFCQTCGFITNLAFDPSLIDYTQDYEETQGFSGRFNEFARSLAERLIERYDLRGKEILEIGCGKGEFLVLLCELGGNRGLGIDPSYVPERLDTTADVRFIRDYYDDRFSHLTGDLVCCRHTLEHIGPTAEFMERVARSTRARLGAILFLEVPDVRRVLRESAFWDIYHEHCSYFSPGSLARLFRSTGFEVLDLALDFDDQYILLDARIDDGSRPAANPLEETVEEITADVEAFRDHWHDHIERWTERLRSINERGQRAVLWGSGSKGVAFLTTVGIRDEVQHVVDINPFRQNMYMPGTGQRIVAPEALRQSPPDVVIVMNPIYREEIKQELDSMELSPELVNVDALVSADEATER
jgi:SAM-dependent methyltransferase